MHIEIDWVRDPSLAGFHAPVPLQEAPGAGTRDQRAPDGPGR